MEYIGVITNLLPSRELTYPQRHFWVDDFPFPQLGYVSSLEGKLLPALPTGSANLARTAPVKMASSCFFSAALFTASIKSMTNGGAMLGHGFRASTSAFWSEPVP